MDLSTDTLDEEHCGTGSTDDRIDLEPESSEEDAAESCFTVDSQPRSF